MGKKKEQYCPLTRWRYFTKTLYHDPSATGEFTYDGVVYRKSEALQTVESRNSRLQMGLVGLIQKNQAFWKIRPDQKIVVKGEWPTPDDRLKVAERITADLARVAGAA